MFARFLMQMFALFFGALRLVLRRRSDLVLENMALKQQLVILQRQRPRPKLTDVDRAFWVGLRRVWMGWAARLVVVKPQTVVEWHRRRFRRYWNQISRRGRGPGRPAVEKQLRELIRRMATENNWGAPRIHGELLKLGCDVSERTVSRYMPRRTPSKQSVQTWMTFLRNHRQDIAAMDLLVVATAGLRVVYGLFIIHHDRRQILHFNATEHPTADWVVQQLREAFPYETAPKYMIFDRDSIFSDRVVGFLRSIGTTPKRTAYRSPWQNGTAERWVGILRTELLNHVVVLNERHLVRLVRSHVRHYHEDRCHGALNKDTPMSRSVTRKPTEDARVVASARVGGLHHRYEWCAAA